MSHPAITASEPALRALPSALATVALQRLQHLIEIPNLAAPLDRAVTTKRGRQLLLSLPRVLACSDFISHALIHTSGLLAELIDTDCVLNPRDSGEIGQRLAAACAGRDTTDALMPALRVIRRRELARIGWRDLAGLAPLTEVVDTLSQLADKAIQTALAIAHQEICQQHGEPIGAESGRSLGLVVLGLGKLGGRELNFSSDVDLIFAYPETGNTRSPKSISNQEFFVKVGQRIIRILGEVTADGFVFRMDMRLRPNGDSGPLVLSFDATNHYYLTHGRDWERYALIKARLVAGNKSDGYQLLEALRPFVYRKYLDFGAFEAIRSMKNLIERELLRKKTAGDLKLGRGGIREIEFIVQAHQLIRAGREPSLQTESLWEALKELEALSVIESNQADELRFAYDVLRRTEHRLQVIEDLQTHQIPDDSEQQQRLAIAMNFSDWTTFNNQLHTVLTSVHEQFQAVFTLEREAYDPRRSSEWLDIWQGTLEADDAKTVLRRRGFDQPDRVLELLDALRSSRFYHAFSSLGRDRLDRLMPAVLIECSNSAAPMVALARVISVIEAIGRRSAYLSLLSENPLALSQLVTLITASRGISNWIGLHPVILDELLDPISSYQAQSPTEIKAELSRKVVAVKLNDLEALMDLLREYQQGYSLRLAAADIAGLISRAEISIALCDLAEIILEQALAISAANLNPAQAPDIIQRIGIVAYGKLGSRELGYNSDLDLIFLCEQETGGESDYTTGYYKYSRLVQRLVHVLTTRTQAGQLYEIDMRLRPSGRSGMAINTLTGFTSYQLQQAHAWEHQALVRARMVLGSNSLQKQFELVRRQVLCQPRENSELCRSVIDMRERIIAVNCRSTKSQYDFKLDRGGLLDIEFLLQYLVLRWAHQHPKLADHRNNEMIIRTLIDTDILDLEDAARLTDILEYYLATENHLKLQEKPALIATTKFSEERQWIKSLWQRLLENSD